MSLPEPDQELLDAIEARFEPEPELAAFARAELIEGPGPLQNERYRDHNLQDAHIGFLWANVECHRKGRRVLGRCKLGSAGGSDMWTKKKKEQQAREWFGELPDFIITLDAEFWIAASVESRLALLEHELHHCGQQTDDFGMPQFNARTGRPKFCILPHDVEEFAGVVERYGADAARVRRFIEAAERGPTIGEAEIEGACGTCMRRAA